MNKNTEEKNLYVFGYGLALLIPFLVTMHSLHLGFSFLKLICFLLMFAFIMFITIKISSFPAKTNAWIMIVQFLAMTQATKNDLGVISYLLFFLSTIILIVTILDVMSLRPIYKYWMIGAHFIGNTITCIILTIFFYFVFGIVGIILRLLRKDVLDQNLDMNAKSYWLKRREEPYKKENYTRQF